jgi:hypothetical protein
MAAIVAEFGGLGIMGKFELEGIYRGRTGGGFHFRGPGMIFHTFPPSVLEFINRPKNYCKSRTSTFA